MIAFIACQASAALGEVELPEPSLNDSINISAEAANRWISGLYDVWLLRGNCRIQQGAADARSSEAVLWIERADGRQNPERKIIAYMEGDVFVLRTSGAGPVKLVDKTWQGRFTTKGEIQVYAGQVAGQPAVMPEIFERGQKRLNPISPDAVMRSEVRQAQFTQPAGPAPRAEVIQTPPPQPGPQGRRIRVFPRSDVPVQAQWFPDPRGEIFGSRLSTRA